jgi:hypothetical protein
MQHNSGRIDHRLERRLVGGNRVRGGANDGVDHCVAITRLRVASRKNRGAEVRLRPLQHDFEVAATESGKRRIQLCSPDALVDRRKRTNQFRARIGIDVTSFSRVFRHAARLSKTVALRRNRYASAISSWACAINFNFVSKMNPHISEKAAQNITAVRGLKCSPMYPTARLPSGAVPMNDSV